MQPTTENRTDPQIYEDLGGRELVERICLGDIEALLHLVVDRCGGFVKATGAALHYDGDLAHDVCVHLFGRDGDWSKLRSWKGPAPLESWMLTVIKRVCLTEIRKAVKHRSHTQRLPESPEDPQMAKGWSALLELEQKESISRILRAVEQLKERDRTIIQLRCLDDPPMTPIEVAELLGMESGALRVAEMRAKRRLAEILGIGREGEDHV